LVDTTPAKRDEIRRKRREFPKTETARFAGNKQPRATDVGLLAMQKSVGERPMGVRSPTQAVDQRASLDSLVGVTARAVERRCGGLSGPARTFAHIFGEALAFPSAR
jgi:hypothetical protein